MSEKELMTILIGVGIFIVFCLPIIFLVRKRIKINRLWKDFARNNHLKLREGRYPAVSGQLDGRAFEMGSGVGRKPISGRADRSQMVEFYAWVEIKGSLPEGFAASKKGWADGKGPIQTESESFNKKIWAESKNVSKGEAFLTPERQDMLLQLAQYKGGVFDATGDFPPHVLISQSGYKVRQTWLEERKELLLKAAAVFDNTS